MSNILGSIQQANRLAEEDVQVYKEAVSAGSNAMATMIASIETYGNNIHRIVGDLQDTIERIGRQLASFDDQIERQPPQSPALEQIQEQLGKLAAQKDLAGRKLIQFEGQLEWVNSLLKTIIGK